jgi:hypothetical protein
MNETLNNMYTSESQGHHEQMKKNIFNDSQGHHKQTMQKMFHSSNGPYARMPDDEAKYTYESDSEISVHSKKSSSSSSSDENRSWQQDPTILHNNAYLGRHTSFNGITGGGGNAAARTMRYLHIALFTVLPITEHISTWYHKQGSNKSLKNFTVASVAADMTIHRPRLVETILDVTASRGSMARDKLMLAYDMMQADGQSHPMVIMAIMAFFWTNDEK